MSENNKRKREVKLVGPSDDEWRERHGKRLKHLEELKNKEANKFIELMKTIDDFKEIQAMMRFYKDMTKMDEKEKEMEKEWKELTDKVEKNWMDDSVTEGLEQVDELKHKREQLRKRKEVINQYLEPKKEETTWYDEWAEDIYECAEDWEKAKKECYDNRIITPEDLVRIIRDNGDDLDINTYQAAYFEANINLFYKPY